MKVIVLFLLVGIILSYTPNKAVEAKLDMALSTTFGFGGHNACIALRKYSDQ